MDILSTGYALSSCIEMLAKHNVDTRGTKLAVYAVDGEGVVLPYMGLYVRLQRVLFFSRFGHKSGINFGHKIIEYGRLIALLQ